MHLSPRPSPRDVCAYFADALRDDALRDDALRAAVQLLDRDPNWQVSSTPGPRAWDLTLCYAPEGTSYALHVERATAAWHLARRPLTASPDRAP